MNPEIITLELTQDQVNVILESLIEMPFKKVVKVIETIHQQASYQLDMEKDNLSEDNIEI